MLQVYHIRHDSVLIQTHDYNILIDPFRFVTPDFNMLATGIPTYIFYTHDHYDHLDTQTLNILSMRTNIKLIILPKSSINKFLEGPHLARFEPQLVLVEPNKTYSKISSEFTVYTVPAYNINKFRQENIPYHPKQNNWVGYIIDLNTVYMPNFMNFNIPYYKKLRPTNIRTIMHTGDSDNIPEYKNLPIDVDMLFVPVSGTYVMTVKEACDATHVINPGIVVPMHWGEIVGTKEQAQEFIDCV